MNRITKYLTTGAAALLMLMSVGAVQNNANAARKHYRNHTTRQVKIRRHKSWRRSIKSQKKSVKRTRRNKRLVKRSRKARRDRRANKGHRIRRNRRRKQAVLKPRYKIAKNNRELERTGFYDGRILASPRLGYPQGISNWVFSKYAPSDRRARIPNYMNPRRPKNIKSANYHSINSYLWAKGNFNLTNPKKDARHPQVYKYYPKAHGWKLAPKLHRQTSALRR